LYYRQEAYRRQFATQSIAILFPVPTEHRRRLVLSYLEAEIRAYEARMGTNVRRDLFWVSEADPRTAGSDYFTGACWYRPFEPDPRPLLPGETVAEEAPSSEYAFGTGMMGQEAMLRFYHDIGERPPITATETSLDEIV
jgi:hypothetical protein